ncbi:MAG: carboxypeptidase regulatory-like domain-containing protein, partial [Acidobacteria bacterium]|nr:carboxypeptidase regulatory-like domain-containing protein [Acidobacteriota bacterium]
WFAGYQATRSRSAASAQTHTVTQAALTGDFSALESAACQSNGKGRTLKAPFSANNKTTPSHFDQAALNLFSQGYVPISSDPCGLVNYTVPSINNEDEIIGKVDLNISPKQVLFGRYFIDDYRSPAPFDPHDLILTQYQGNSERAQTFTLGHTYTFTPTFINSFHATVSRRRDNRSVDPRDINPTAIGVNMYVTVPDFFLISSTGGYFQIGCGTCAPGYFNVNTGQIADDVDWIRGKHHLAFGVDFIHTQNNTLSGYDENGTFSFTGNVTGDGLADFLLGAYGGFSQSHAQKVAYRENIPSLYAQDIYKITRGLAITAGLRWEPTLWPSDYFHRGSLFNVNDFLNNAHSSIYPAAAPGFAPPAGMLYYHDRGVPAAFTNNHWRNFAPRLALAWDPSGAGRQSLRAGYGLLYDSAMAWFTQRLTSNPPFVDQIDNTQGCGTFSNPWLNYAQGSGCGTTNAAYNPFPAGANVFPAGSFWVSLPSTMRPLYMQQWNLSYERQFLNAWVFSLAYLGSRSLHVPLAYDANYIETSPTVCAEFGATGCTTANEPQRRLLYQSATGGRVLAPGRFTAQYAEGLGIIDQADDTGYSNYNGLLATIEHRFRQGYSVQANYTFSHCLGDGDFNGDLRQSYYSVPTNPRLEYGNCNFDIRHIFNVSMVATSPLHGKGAVRWLLGGWQFAPSIRVLSGYPVNIVNGKDSLADGNESSGSNVGARPELVPGQPVYVNRWVGCGTGGVNLCYQLFNPAAFADPTSPTAPVPINPKVGNVYAYTPIRRDQFYGPGVVRVDAALSRIFPVRERTQLELRFEAFNAINKFNIRPTSGIGASAAINSSTFGLITSAPTPGFFPSDYDQRILQFALKLHF